MPDKEQRSGESLQLHEKLQRKDAEWAKQLSEQEESARKKDLEWAARFNEQEDAVKKNAEWAQRYSDLNEEHRILKKRMLEMSRSLRGDMWQDRREKEQMAMQLEDQRSGMLILLEKNHQQSNELLTWQTAKDDMAAQLEVVNRVSNRVWKGVGQESEATVDCFWKQPELEDQVHNSQDESKQQKQLIQSILAREQQALERLTMKAEDYLSKAWEYHDFGITDRSTILRQSDLQCSRNILDQILTRVARKEEVARWQAIEVERDQVRKSLHEHHLLLAQKNAVIDVLERNLKDLQETSHQFQVLSLQPLQAPGDSHSHEGKDLTLQRKDSKLPQRDEMKAMMHSFLQQLLKGQTTTLVQEGGGTAQCTLSISKDIKVLAVKHAYQTYFIPISEIQQVIAGKDLPPNVWTSTPLSDKTVCILFGPSPDEQHCCCFREESHENRDKLANGLKVLRLSMLGAATRTA